MKRLLLFLALLLAYNAHGQIAPDTDMFEKMYPFYEQNPVFFTEIPIKNFTLSGIYLHHQGGALHLAQQPGKQTDFGLSSEGFYRHKKVNFFGKINLQRLYQSDKGWTLSDEDVQDNGLMPDPHYFAVSRPAPWNNQKYNLFGGVALPIYKHLWNVALSTQINYDLRFRDSYDPRPKITHNELHFALQTGLRFLPKHKIALSAHYGYHNIKNNIRFSDAEGNAAPNFWKYNRWLLGYGNFQLSAQDNNRRNKDTYGFALSYHFAGERETLLVEGNYTNTLTHTFLNANESQLEEDIIARLYQDQWQGRLHYLRNLANDQNLSVSLTTTIKDAYNRLLKRRGKNYQSYQEDISLSVNLLKQQGDRHREMAFEVAYQGAYQKDAMAKILTDHASLTLALLWAKEYSLDGFTLRPLTRAGYTAPLLNKLINQNEDYHKPFAQNDYAARTLHLFYEEVVYPDFKYFDTPMYHLTLGCDFKKRLANGTKLITSLHSSYRSTLKGADRYALTMAITLLK